MNVFKNTRSYNSVARANDTKIQNIIGKDIEPHSYWYWTKFECIFETFNIFCPLFFPKHHNHEIKNQTRQHNLNFNFLLHSKLPNLIISSLSLSLSCPPIANATTIKILHHHWTPHNPQPLQAISHNTTKNQINHH